MNGLEDVIEKLIKSLVKNSQEKTENVPLTEPTVKEPEIDHSVKELASRISADYEKTGYSSVADVFSLIASNAEHLINEDLTKLVKAGSDKHKELVFDLIEKINAPYSVRAGLLKAASITYGK